MLGWLRIVIPSVILLIAIIIGLKLKKQFYLSPYRVLLTVGFIASIFIAVGLGIQLWSFQLMKPFMPAYKGLVQNYLQARNNSALLMQPDEFLNTTTTIISSVDDSSYWGGFARGILVLAGAVLFIIFIPFKKLFNRPSNTNNQRYQQLIQEMKNKPIENEKQSIEFQKQEVKKEFKREITKPKPAEKNVAIPISEEELNYIKKKEEKEKKQEQEEKQEIIKKEEESNKDEPENKEENKEIIEGNIFGNDKEEKIEIEEEVIEEKIVEKEYKQEINNIKEELAELKDAIHLLIKQ